MNNIKKILISLALILSISLTTDLMSQTENVENTNSRISLGFEGGVQFTDVYDNWAYSSLPEGKVGFNLGLFADYKIIKTVKFRLGLYYDKRGFKEHDVVSPIAENQGDSIYISYPSYYETDFDYNFNYLTIPFSIFYEKGNENFSIFIQGGIYYSLLLGASRTGFSDLYIYPEHADKFNDERLKTPGHTITDSNNEDVHDYFVANDWGLQLFIGVVFHINEKLHIQLTPGLTQSFEKLYASPNRDSGWSSYFKINAGIIYTLN